MTISDTQKEILRILIQHIKTDWSGSYGFKPVVITVQKHFGIYLAVGFSRQYHTRVVEEYFVLGELPKSFAYYSVPQRAEGPNDIFLNQPGAVPFWVSSRIRYEQSVRNLFGPNFMICPFPAEELPDPSSRSFSMVMLPVEV